MISYPPDGFGAALQGVTKAISISPGDARTPSGKRQFATRHVLERSGFPTAQVQFCERNHQNGTRASRLWPLAH